VVSGSDPIPLQAPGDGRRQHKPPGMLPSTLHLLPQSLNERQDTNFRIRKRLCSVSSTTQVEKAGRAEEQCQPRFACQPGVGLSDLLALGIPAVKGKRCLMNVSSAW
jgi:hypothetical protein